MAVELETWVNEGNGTMCVLRLAPNGAVRSELVRGRARFKLTPEEREMNHTASQEGLDPFLNGTFSCVDGADVPESPNRLTDDDIVDLLNMQWKRAEARLREITSAAALGRLLAAAVDSDAGEKRVGMIRARLAEVDPSQPQSNRVRRAVDRPSQTPAPQQVDLYNLSPDGAPSLVPDGPKFD